MAKGAAQQIYRRQGVPEKNHGKNNEQNDHAANQCGDHETGETKITKAAQMV